MSVLFFDAEVGEDFSGDPVVEDSGLAEEVKDTEEDEIEDDECPKDVFGFHDFIFMELSWFVK